MRRITFTLLPILVLAGTFVAFRADVLRSQEPAAITAPEVQSFLIRLGLTDRQERVWDGKVSVSGGDLVTVRDWRPRTGNQVNADGSWKQKVVKGINFNWRAHEDTPDSPPYEYYRPQGVVIDVKGGSPRVNVSTANGQFSFRPADIAAGAEKRYLDGAASVARVASAQPVSSPDHQNDFASITALKNGDVWVSWLGYRSNANEVLARRWDGKRWHDIVKVSEKPGDYHLVKLGRDGQDRLWAVWPAQVESNWDLYARSWDGKAWSQTERLTNAPQQDIFPNVATDSQGRLWVVWQGFRNGKSDIFARRLEGSQWSAEEKVSPSPANDWEPVIATDSRGRTYVAWDTYDKGNYDVMLRTWSGSQWEEATPITSTPLYEAHVSLAVDGNDRLWAAWNESGANWGKDTGWYLNLEGTRLYEWRTINVAVRENNGWKEPLTNINHALPEGLRTYNDFPLLHTAPSGQVWLFFRNRTSRIHDVHSDTPNHRASWEIWATTLDGRKWRDPQYVPFTRGRQDVRWGLANGAGNSVLAAWPTDNRDYEDFLFDKAEVMTGRLPLDYGRMAAPELKPRIEAEIPFFARNLQEEEDLRRIRGYQIRSGGKQYRIYRGDTHRHTEFSMDGNNDGSLMQTYRYAIDAASLDYLLVSEHNGAGGPDIEYINWLLQQAVDLFSIPDTFRPFYGYERSVSYPNGHRNVLLVKRGIPTLPIPRSEAQGQTGAEALYAYLKDVKGIAISHTSATNMGTDWRDNDPEVEPLVEIYQGDRVSAEYLGAPRAANAKDPGSAPGGFRPLGYVWKAWEKGYKLGIQAASDHLSTHISYACTISEDFSLDGMLQAMKKRHNYGATDNMILDYRMRSGGKEYLQGDIVEVSGPFELVVKIIGTSPMRQVDIIRSQEFLHNVQNLDQNVEFTFTDRNPKSGESYYYVRAIQHDGQIAWSSPIWVTRR